MTVVQIKSPMLIVSRIGDKVDMPTAPGGDLFVGKTQVNFHHFPNTEFAIIYYRVK